jgi:transglutaminase-like putative cysteine protease
VTREPLPLLAVKALIAAGAACLFMYPLTTPAGFVATALGTVGGYAAARYAAARGLRVPAALAIAFVLGVIARELGQLLLVHPVGTLARGLNIADAMFCATASLALFLAIRTLSQAWRPAAVLELAVVVGAVAHTFAGHRHHRIHEPRFLTDWAWSHGIDPLVVLQGFGIAAVVVAAILLLDLRRASKLVVSLVFLVLGGAVAFWAMHDIRITLPADTNDIPLGRGSGDVPGAGSGSGSAGSAQGSGSAGSDQDSSSGSSNGSSSGSSNGSSGSGNGSSSGSGSGGGTAGGGSGSSSGSGGGSGGGGGQSQKPPDPVAIVVLHDDLPEADVYYLRQAVLSRFAEDRLEEDTTGRYDTDVIRQFPSAAGPVDAPSLQAPELHQRVQTSVYLLVDHAAPFGIGHPYEVRALDNPNPRQFVGAYDVDSWLLTSDFERLAGHSSVPATWSEDEKQHYLKMPADPRYADLSNQIVRDMDPRFVGDDLMKALALKRYLEQTGFYSLAEKTLVGTDPTAKFLFGAKRGYCVHFAHAMALLLRSQGIPSRVALGYAVQTRRHGAGSSLLVLGTDAHAWPEMYLDGVGWVTIDVYPEHSDEPPQPPVDEELETTLGELARKDPTGGHAADPHTHLQIPWGLLGELVLALVGSALAAAYVMKLARQLRRGSTRTIYIGVLDRLSDLGLGRQLGETRERHAARLADKAPTFAKLTREHLRGALGTSPVPLDQFRDLAKHTRAELRRSTSLWRRIGAALHPLGWLFTR